MQIIDLRATVVRIPRPESLFSGTAGLRGQARRAADSSYQIVEPYPTVYSTAVEALLVEIETDAGVTGVGEGQFPVAPEAGAVLAECLIRPLLLGTDPTDRERLYAMLYGAMRCRGHFTGMYLDAVAAADNALWDLTGKVLGEPVWRLLGGRKRGRIPVYVSGLAGASREDRVREALDFRRQGFRAMKIFGGHGVDEDVTEATALREALGPDVALCVDAQWMYDPPTAIRLGRELERLGVAFFETPVAPEDLAGTAAVAEALTVPVAGGECERTRYQFTPWLDARALDIVQVDVGRCGTTESRNIARLIDERGRPLALHLGVGLFGYIASSLQVAAWAPGLHTVEYQPQMVALASGLLEEPFVTDGGQFIVPEGPGIGVRVNAEALEPYVVRPRGGRWRDVAG
ncbi:MAG TPA: mandelate racemase/muconate lactonizing enzyme family protein [bacterium]|nr:mandelate racemase/muconate lactonizing enzyme family protein [bacterium]